MTRELRHEETADPNKICSTDWQDIDTHRFASQAIGDLPYADSVTQIKALSIGSNEDVLTVGTNKPAWKTPAQYLAILSGEATAAFDFNSQNLTSVGLLNTHTIPGGTDTLVGRATTDTLTNKTLTSPTINGTIATTGLTLPAVTLGGALTAYAGSGIVRTATKVVAASDSDATAKLQADYVCNGTNDEVELLASLTDAGTRGSVVWLPGNYTLGATLTFPDSLDGFVLYAEGTKLTYSPATGDAVSVRGINESRLYFGEIVSNTTGALLTVKPTATHYKYNKITFVHLGGIAAAQNGIGLKIDNSVQGLNVGQISGGDIVFRGTGVHLTNAPAGNKQDTLWFWLNHIRECTTLIQEGTSGAPNIDTNVWHVNMGNPITMGLDTYAVNGKYFLIIEAGSGKVITLNSGVANAIIETSPPLQSGDLTDNSGVSTNKITTSLGNLGNLAFYSGTAYQVSFDHAASANRVITVPDATDTMALIAATQTLTNKTLTSPTLTTPTISGITPTGAGVMGYGAGTLNYGDGAANHILVSADQGQTLTNKTLTSPTINGTIATTGLTLPAITLSGVVDVGHQALNGVFTIAAAAGYQMFLYAKRQTGGDQFVIYTPGVTPGFADTERMRIGNAAAIALVTWSAVTHSGLDITSGQVLKVAGTQVVGAQGAAVADATDAASVILRLNELLARCRAHGFIAA